MALDAPAKGGAIEIHFLIFEVNSVLLYLFKAFSVTKFPKECAIITTGFPVNSNKRLT